MQSKRRKPAQGIEPPRLPKRLTPGELPDGRLVEGGGYTRLLLSSGDWSNQEAADLYFEEVHLKRILMYGTRLPALQLVDVRVEGCDLAGADWDKPHFNRLEIVGSRLTGVKLLKARIENGLIKDCNAEFAMFWEATFEAVRFESCNLREASFLGANLAGVVFDRCDLSGANFQDATLAGADLRGSKLDGLRVGLRELQGAIVDPQQAAQVASLLGMTVKWE